MPASPSASAGTAKPTKDLRATPSPPHSLPTACASSAKATNTAARAASSLPVAKNQTPSSNSKTAAMPPLTKKRPKSNSTLVCKRAAARYGAAKASSAAWRSATCRPASTAKPSNGRKACGRATKTPSAPWLALATRLVAPTKNGTTTCITMWTYWSSVAGYADCLPPKPARALASKPCSWTNKTNPAAGC